MTVADTLGMELHSLEASRQRVLKAHFISRDSVAESNAVTAPDDVAQMFTNAGAIEPRYEPELLARLLEQSNSLRQSIDAYVTNIDGFGHELVPVIDLEADDADAKIANAIWIEKLKQWEDEHPTEDTRLEPPPSLLWPTDQEVAARKERLRGEMRVEKTRLANFLDYCTVGYSLLDLRMLTRFDVELLGNGYWEVLRNNDTRRN